MIPQDRIQTFVFPDETTVLAAIKVLVRSGVRASRLSIHIWGREFALRPLDGIETGSAEALLALGARLGVDGAGSVSPHPSTPSTDSLGALFGTTTTN